MELVTLKYSCIPNLFARIEGQAHIPNLQIRATPESLRTDISEVFDLPCTVYLLTSEVRSICQLHFFTGLGDDTSNTMLDEIHFLPHSPFSNDVVSRLEHLKSQLAQHGSHKIGIRVSKERHRSHQFPAVEVDYFLKVAKVSTKEEEIESYLEEKYMLTFKKHIYRIMDNLHL